MSGNPGLAIWDYAYRISPIFLTGGVAGNLLGGGIPVLQFLQIATTLFGGLSEPGNITLDNAFAHFRPLPGTTLIAQDLGKYPFANQSVAANATIRMPLHISMLMECAVRPPNSYWLKFAAMQALQSMFDQHNNAGGTYSVLTPTFLYTDCIMLRMVDISTGESNQPQITWQLDFEKPLVTLQAAAQAMNNYMTRVTNQTPLTSSSWTGPDSVIGSDVTGGVSSQIVPSAGTGTAPSVGQVTPAPGVAGSGVDVSSGSVNTAPQFGQLPP